MSAEPPLLIDLTQFVAGHKADPNYRLLAKLVRNAYSMTSVRMDLHHALAMMDHLAAQQAGFREDARAGRGLDPGRALVASSLFVASLLLYTRSVHSQGRDRSTLNISDRLDPRLRTLHNRIVELRNQHFAHYTKADEWEDWRVLAVFRERGLGISLPNDRRFIRANDAQALHELLGAVQSLATVAYEKAAQRLIKEVYRLIENDDDFAASAGECRFKPADFFSEDELPGFYESIIGETAFWHSPQYRAAFGAPEEESQK